MSKEEKYLEKEVEAIFDEQEEESLNVFKESYKHHEKKYKNIDSFKELAQSLINSLEHFKKAREQGSMRREADALADHLAGMTYLVKEFVEDHQGELDKKKIGELNSIAFNSKKILHNAEKSNHLKYIKKLFEKAVKREDLNEKAQKLLDNMLDHF